MATILDLAYPFTGRWLVQNSPANRVPSHGTTRFASSFAIDFVPVDSAGRTAPVTMRTLLRTEPPARFSGFGREILAPIDGVVVATHDGEADHHAYRGLPSLAYALTQGRRAQAGWRALAGNHLLIDADGVVVALCHLQRGSLLPATGQHLRAGMVVGRCGNSGNTTEPHLHVQAISSTDPARARAIPVTFEGGMPANGATVRVGAETT